MTATTAASTAALSTGTEAPSDESTRISTSVLVVTGGRDEHLARVLAGLQRSRPLPDEVVVVFMNQPEGQVPACPLPVVVGHVADAGAMPLAAGRQRAAELAGGHVLVFLDVDCIPAVHTVGRLAAEVRRHDGAFVMGAPRYLRPGWLRAAGQSPPASPSASPSDAATGSSSGSGPGALPGDQTLHALSVPHHVRSTLPVGPTEAWHLMWSLVLAVRGEDLAAVGGFDAGFTGYGAEDTDLAFRARDAGLRLRFSAAEVFHQHHGVHRPPLHHFAEILVNARRFRRVHGIWPMEGWLGAFAQRGLVVWDPDGERLQVLREPTVEEVEAAHQPEAPY